VVELDQSARQLRKRIAELEGEADEIDKSSEYSESSVLIAALRAQLAEIEKELSRVSGLALGSAIGVLAGGTGVVVGVAIKVGRATVGLTTKTFKAIRGMSKANRKAFFAEVKIAKSTGDVQTVRAILRQVDEGTWASATKGGFGSFSSLKRHLGPAGEGRHWHHIVEQSKVGQFGKQTIHSVDNVISIPAPIHHKITGFYGSIQDFTGGLKVRNWLKGQSLEFQREFGLDILKKFGAL